MLIDIDSRGPLKFSRKAESPEGEEVTLEIKYEMLFKHCTECGLMTHEKEQYPKMEVPQSQNNRTDVFTRVQMPRDRFPTLPLLGNSRYTESHNSRQPLLGSNQNRAAAMEHPRLHDRIQRPHFQAGERGQYQEERNRVYGSYQKSHKDRIICGREGRKDTRLGASRYGNRPYDRKPEGIWREKNNKEIQTKGRKKNMMPGVVAPYEQPLNAREKTITDKVYKSHEKRPIEEPRNVEEPKSKRLASAIVTTNTASSDQLANVTIRGLARTLTFSPASLQKLLRQLHEQSLLKSKTSRQQQRS
ncbi:Uncharacterized protein Rs2_38819 [Raphanus sativus]|nr:Uncharacterized protein Rs2_38819 [Raphanus sativus]